VSNATVMSTVGDSSTKNLQQRAAHSRGDLTGEHIAQ
jgi:hypothetical protein